MEKRKILVLGGGKSSEREVSLRSGAAVARALGEAGFSVTLLDPGEESLWEIREKKPDAVFIALHGKGGEDGAVQGALEWMGLPFTGPGIGASALCMNKIMTKKILSFSGVATPRFLEIGEEEKKDPEQAARRAVEALGLPLVFKAACQGSSIGTVIVREAEEAAEALKSLFSYGDRILAEEFLSGTELTVPILGNGLLTVLPVIEIASDGAFYDYLSKYTPGKSRHIIPARITKEQNALVSDLARRAYRATGCRGYARVDVMMDSAGVPFVLEINTSPGMTETSLFPDAARAAGISFPELVTRMVELALEESPGTPPPAPAHGSAPHPAQNLF